MLNVNRTVIGSLTAGPTAAYATSHVLHGQARARGALEPMHATWHANVRRSLGSFTELREMEVPVSTLSGPVVRLADPS